MSTTAVTSAVAAAASIRHHDNTDNEIRTADAEELNISVKDRSRPLVNQKYDKIQYNTNREVGPLLQAIIKTNAAHDNNASVSGGCHLAL